MRFDATTLLIAVLASLPVPVVATLTGEFAWVFLAGAGVVAVTVVVVAFLRGRDASDENAAQLALFASNGGARHKAHQQS
jgi:hypothetical protein